MESSPLSPQSPNLATPEAVKADLGSRTESLGYAFASRKLASAISQVGDSCLRVTDFVRELETASSRLPESISKDQLPEDVLSFSAVPNFDTGEDQNDFQAILQAEVNRYIAKADNLNDEQRSNLDAVAIEHFRIGVANMRHGLDYSLRTFAVACQNLASDMRNLREGAVDQISAEKLLGVGDIGSLYESSVGRFVNLARNGFGEESELPSLQMLDRALAEGGFNDQWLERVAGSLVIPSATGQIDQDDRGLTLPRLNTEVSPLSSELLGTSDTTSPRVLAAFFVQGLRHSLVAASDTREAPERVLNLRAGQDAGSVIVEMESEFGVLTQRDIQELKTIIDQLPEWSLDVSPRENGFRVLIAREIKSGH